MAISFFTIAAAANVGVVRGALQRPLPRRDAGRPARGHACCSPTSPASRRSAEARGPEQVHAMLVAYFGELAPMIDRRVPTARCRTSSATRSSPSSTSAATSPTTRCRRARAALELQRRAETMRADHPDWPRFRVGINTGPVLAGVVGDKRPPHPRRLRRHRQPRRAPGGPGTARRGRDRRRDARRPARGRRRRARCPSCTSRASRSRSRPSSCTRSERAAGDHTAPRTLGVARAAAALAR